MKKPKISPLYVLTFAFIIFLTGFFLIRNYGRSPVQVSVIPKQEQTTALSSSDLENPLVDINTATREELTTLPGIGEVLADRIIEYRITHGPFEVFEQLLNVEGIGSGKLIAILNLITIGGK